MNLFNKLPGFERSPPGLEHRLWKRLPAILLAGSLLPGFLALTHRLWAWADPLLSADRADLLKWDFMLAGLLLLHWMTVLTLALLCFIVRVMKGPAYVADAYPLPDEGAEP